MTHQLAGSPPEDIPTAVRRFLDDHVLAAEAEFHRHAEANRPAHTPFETPAIMESPMREAQRRRLWNLNLPDALDGVGLSVSRYAPIAELCG